LYIVVAYYFFFAKEVKKALEIYYARIGKPFGAKVYFNHLFNYAVTMSDRFISKTDPQLYYFEDYFNKFSKEVEKQGVLMASTHYGGWASGGNYFTNVNTKINVVMNESMMEQTKNFYSSLNLTNEERINVIDVSNGIASSIAIANALLNNECVAMMVDRAYRKRDLIAHPFFNKDAYFNKSPFALAYKADKAILCYMFVLIKPLHYKTLVKKITIDKSLDEDAAIRKALGEYVSFLEYNLNLYPDQWFNFYDFWSSDGISYR
jgi:predicted LPLAT superfamily acyltransferase